MRWIFGLAGIFSWLMSVNVLAAPLAIGQKGFTLNLKDQYDKAFVYPLTGDLLNEDGGSPAVAVIIADKEGKDQASAWGKELQKAFAAQMDRKARPGLVVLPVAHLKGVPGLMRPMVKGFFVAPPDAPQHLATGLDWYGEVDSQVAVSPGVANLLVLSPAGVLAYKTTGAATPDAQTKLFQAIKTVLK